MLNDEDKRSTKRQKRDLFFYVDYVDRSKRKKMAGKAREENKKQKKGGKGKTVMDCNSGWEDRRIFILFRRST